jgi:hypothetical protein
MAMSMTGSSLLLLPVPPFSLSFIRASSAKKIDGEWMFRFLHFVRQDQQRAPWLLSTETLPSQVNRFG